MKKKKSDKGKGKKVTITAETPVLLTEDEEGKREFYLWIVFSFFQEITQEEEKSKNEFALTWFEGEAWLRHVWSLLTWLNIFLMF